MFIKEEDFRYLEGLYKGLDDERKKKFLRILLKAGSLRSGEEDIRKIEVVDDEIFGLRAIEPGGVHHKDDGQKGLQGGQKERNEAAYKTHRAWQKDHVVFCP